MIHEDGHTELLVQANAQETGTYRSIYFRRPRDFAFVPGDWIELAQPGRDVAGGNVYSLSSSPEEPELRITFREGASPFKRLLGALVPGEVLTLLEYGNDHDFRIREHRSSVLIAGGVGVTPFRSMMRQAADDGLPNDVRLIYFNSSPDFLFAEEFRTWSDSVAGFDADLINTRETSRKARERLLRELPHSGEHRYYVSGPTSMVQSTRETLTSVGVLKSSIKVDDFGMF